MLLLRLAALLAIIAIGASALGYLFTRDRRYLRFAWRLTQFLVAAALAVFGLMALERLIVLV